MAKCEHGRNDETCTLCDPSRRAAIDTSKSDQAFKEILELADKVVRFEDGESARLNGIEMAKRLLFLHQTITLLGEPCPKAWAGR